ncbi:MAG TPA: PDZ domain-containing protein [Thermomicrobiales bacterium]|nr:PDZ domain-containing protein [Thermomicrobiales bacterium]
MIERVSGPSRPPLGILGANAADYLSRHPEARAGAPTETSGVFIGEIRPGSVAERAGLWKGDIIIGCAGKKVKDMSSLDTLIAAVKPGEQINVRFIRQGQEEMATLQF